MFLCLTFTSTIWAQNVNQFPRFCLTIGTERVVGARLSLITLNFGFTDIVSLQNLPRSWRFTVDNENSGNTIFAFAHQTTVEASGERLTESDLILEHLPNGPSGELRPKSPANNPRYCLGIDYRRRWPHALGGFDLRLAYAAIVPVPTLPLG